MSIINNKANRIKKIFEILKKTINLPEIDHGYYDHHKYNPYTLLVCMILSIRSIEKQINRVAARLFPTIKTPQDMLELGLEALTIKINSLSGYRNKAKYIITTSQILIDKFNSQVPDTRESLMSLPGIGPKSADVILNAVYGKHTVPVDSHIMEFAHIMNLTKSNDREKVTTDLEELFSQYLEPQTFLDAHHLMVLYNRNICTGVKNKDHICPIEGYCEIKMQRRNIMRQTLRRNAYKSKQK